VNLRVVSAKPRRKKGGLCYVCVTSRMSRIFIGIVAAMSSAAVVAAPQARLPEPPTDSSYYEDGQPDPAKVQLGAQLFFDKVISGNSGAIFMIWRSSPDPSAGTTNRS